MLHVPYKSNVSALQDVVGGQISTLISALPQIVGPARSGRLRVLAVTGHERSEALPEAPTFREAGYDGFFQLGVLVLLAPRKSTSSEMNVLGEAVLRYVRTSEWANAIRKFGQSPHPKNSAEMQREFADAATRWRAAIEATGFKPEE
jgi:tripartite-type tricarboxylate transporter receptor subunit TctC